MADGAGQPPGRDGDNGHPWVDWDNNSRSRSYRGSGNFATFLIIGPTFFFLGILFAMFPYDFPLLWSSAPVPDAYFDVAETHLKFMQEAPPLIGRILNMMVSLCFLGFFAKLYRPSEANVLFDGASLVLFLMAVGIYSINISAGLRAAASGEWRMGDFRGSVHRQPWVADAPVDREESLKVIAASNCILALALFGVLVLQTGQWYAEKMEMEELERMDGPGAVQEGKKSR